MRVLISAYACEPGKGSEHGVGWNWAVQIAERHETWVLTRSSNRRAIEIALGAAPIANLRFVYLDSPGWMRFWKRGRHGVRIYYTLWQLLALVAARRLHKRQRFDLVHHLTFANFWLPALACLTAAPFVWGPVGGGVPAPWRLWRSFGFRGLAFEAMRATGRWTGRWLNPLVRLSWRRASVILVQNNETRDRLPRRHWHKVIVCPNGGIEEKEVLDHRSFEREAASLRLLYVGRLLHLKGVTLAIQSLLDPELAGACLTIAGSGPDRARCERLARRLGLENRVRFLGWIERDDIMAVVDAADVLVFPSFHDECGMAVLESMARGVPIVALRRGGPAALVGGGGVCVEPSSADVTARALGRAIVQFADPLHREAVSRAALVQSRLFTWESKRPVVEMAYGLALRDLPVVRESVREQVEWS